MKAFLFGAGSTRGTVGAPTSAGFGRALNCVVPEWQEKYPALGQVVSHLGLPQDNWNLEELWSCMDYYSKFWQAIPKPPDWENECRDLKKALLEVYGRRLDLKADSCSLSDDYTLGYLFKNRVTVGDVLISFNYDTVVERLAKRFGHSLRGAGFARTGLDVILVKPHGSASWAMNFLAKSVEWHSSWGRPRFHSLAPTDVTPCREPLLLGTVPIKSELIQEVQDQGGFHCIFETVVRQWRAAGEAIRDADSLIAVGYGFPKEDHYGRFLIQEALRLRRDAGKPAPTVEFYELRDARCERKQVIMELVAKVYGADTSVPVCRGEVTPAPCSATAQGESSTVRL